MAKHVTGSFALVVHEDRAVEKPVDTRDEFAHRCLDTNDSNLNNMELNLKAICRIRHATKTKKNQDFVYHSDKIKTSGKVPTRVHCKPQPK